MVLEMSAGRVRDRHSHGNGRRSVIRVTCVIYVHIFSRAEHEPDHYHML